VIRFFEERCRHTKAKWAGTPFHLLGWQVEEVIKPLFGTLKPDGTRQYRTCYVEIPKKNGKTEFGGGIGIYGLIADDEPGSEVYSAAGNKEQAGIVYQASAQMVRQDEILKNRLMVRDSVKRIFDSQTASFFQVLSSETDTKHGISPHMVIFDELHAQPNDQLWRVLTAGTDYAREQQLVLVLTTAGVYDPHSIWWKMREKAIRIYEGKEEDDSFLPVLYIADKDKKKDDPEDEKVWIRVNPALGHIFTLDKIRRDFKEAQKDPVNYSDFLRFRLNIPTAQIKQYLPMDDWDACGPARFTAAGYKKFEQSLVGRECYGGIDLSSKIDLTAFALFFPPAEDDEKWKILIKAYMPKDNIRNRAERDQVPYDIWEKAGLITATPGNVVDYAFIRRDIQNAGAIYNIQEIGYDPWKATDLVQRLQDDDGFVMVEMRQGAKTMSDPTEELYIKAKQRIIDHGGHPVLRWCANNLTVKKDVNDNVQPDKKNSKEKIDVMVAGIIALGRAIIHEETYCVYNERGVLAI